VATKPSSAIDWSKRDWNYFFAQAAKNPVGSKVTLSLTTYEEEKDAIDKAAENTNFIRVESVARQVCFELRKGK
jgi:hypothetical protein